MKSFNLFHGTPDTDDILEAWSDLFLQVVDNRVPIKQHRVKHKNQPEWLTPEVTDAIKCRDII